MIRSTIRLLRRLATPGVWVWLTARFVVRVGPHEHYALDMDEALAWARCYPDAFGPAYIRERRTGRTIAIRAGER